MTSFHSRIDSFYAQQQRNVFQSRFQIVWALMVGAGYWLWISTPPAERLDRFAIIFAILGSIVALIALWFAWRIRRVINRIRSMAPGDRDEVLGQHLAPEARDFYAKRLAAEGSVEFDGVVERFAFSPLDRREALALFWGAAAVAAITLAIARGLGGVGETWRGYALAIGMLAVLTMPAFSRRFYRLASLIELTPFAIIEVRPDGRRRWLYWKQPLMLHNRRWLRRVDLAPRGSRDNIPLHYARVGFDRLIAVVLERGGFQTPPDAA
jgi:hypothetical protein